MTRFAFLGEDGTVISILTGTETDWPDLRALDRVQPAPNSNVLPGWRWNGARFLAHLPPVGPRTVTSLEFRRRFTAEEQGAITLAASRGLEQGLPQLQVWLDDLSAAGDVDLDDPLVAGGLNMLVQEGLLAAERVSELLA